MEPETGLDRYQPRAPSEMGQLDQISRAIGGLETSTRSLEKSFDKHCVDDDRRHEQNIAALRENSEQIAKLNELLTPLADTVKTMMPIVAGYQITRWKMAGAFGLVTLLVGGVGWVIEAAIGKLISLMFFKS